MKKGRKKEMSITIREYRWELNDLFLKFSGIISLIFGWAIPLGYYIKSSNFEAILTTFIIWNVIIIALTILFSVRITSRKFCVKR